ncbi:BatA and WFA domain-containing protein [Paenibacillus sp. N3.4]|uniref:vWA domain-containing protein n=1 Tax=Paenibacillus sp. N3.4 TaxID=2603222 RepID=UPI0011C71669|nr:BatA and WFA domain-containing protein [Paenibacillus sp. N3.4]TXK77120.1 VWA domain-containing protein [Paenibacillus sp. N3.4]
MQFASLSGLWFSLAIPFIVLLYLLKRRYIDKEVSSHLLWRRVLREQEANRPWQRLRQQLLLWIQLLAAVLFILALMQPFVWGKHAAKSHVFFVIDASASMQTTADYGTRMDEAKQDILAYARKEAPSSTYSLLVMKDQPELLLQQEPNLSALQAALDKLSPFYGKTKVQEALSLAAVLTRNESQTEVRLYSDTQWSEHLEGIDFSVPVSLNLPQESAPAMNVSISQFGVKVVKNEAKYQAVAVLKNWGSSQISIQTSLYGDAQLIHTDSIQLAAGEQKSIYIDQLAHADVYKMHIEEKDALEADNTAYAFPEGSAQRKVAYVGDGNLFLEKALILAKTEVLNIQKSPDGTYPVPLGQRPDLLILDGVNEAFLQTVQWRKLATSTPIWRIAASSKTSSSDRKEAEVTPFTIADHPVTRYVRLLDATVAQVKTRPMEPWEKPIVSSGTLPLLMAGDENGMPRLTFAFSLQDSDLALRSEFPILVQNAVGWLTEHKGGNLGRFTAGERKEIAFHPEASKAVWQTDIEGVSEQQVEHTGSLLANLQTAPARPGLYQLKEYNANGLLLQSRWLEVVMDGRESNVNAKMAGKLTFIKSVLSHEESSLDGQQSHISLIPWIIVILLLVILLEWEVYRRGHAV